LVEKWLKEAYRKKVKLASVNSIKFTSNLQAIVIVTNNYLRFSAQPMILNEKEVVTINIMMERSIFKIYVM